MKTKDWLDTIINAGLLCGTYMGKVNDAKSKKQLIDICFDANGINFLCEMQEKGMPLPYETICSEFAPFINGKYVAEYRNEKSHGYTSKLYCCYNEPEIVVDTTVCTVLGYSGTIVVAKNNFAKIYLDKNCNVTITLEDGSRAIVEYWAGATVAHNLGDANNKRLQLIEH